MSIARALTRRVKKPDVVSASTSLARSKTMKNSALQIDRTKISGPVALVSTTNMLSYNAPDIATLRKTSSANSTHSADDSDNSSSTVRSRSSSQGSHDTLTDASSVESSPVSPAPNHLSGYFPAPKVARRSVSSSDLQEQKPDSVDAVPAIPQRALSHSKRAHERLAHKRSLQSMPRSSMHSNRSSREQRTSLDMFKATIEEEEVHPFGKELEQLNEVAEEFGGAVRDAEMEADMAAIRERGLAMFCAADYLAEIQPLFSATFDHHPYQAAPMAWI